MVGTGTTSITTSLTMSGASSKSLGDGSNTGRTLINNGTTAFSGGNLNIGDSGGANPGPKFINNGTFNATDEADITRVGFGGSEGSFTNGATGIFNKSGAATTTSVGVAFANSGTVNVDSGALTFTNNVVQFSSGVLSDGIWRVFAGSQLNLPTTGPGIATNQGDVTLSAASSILTAGSGSPTIESTLTSNSGALRILGNRNYTSRLHSFRIAGGRGEVEGRLPMEGFRPLS